MSAQKSGSIKAGTSSSHPTTKITVAFGYEYIALAAAQHDNSVGNKMMFAGQAVAQLRKGYPADARRTLLLVSLGYTVKQKELIEAATEKWGGHYVEVDSLDRLAQYLNQGCPEAPRCGYRIKRLDIYSHGIPRNISLAHELPEEKAFSWNFAFAQKLDKNALALEAEIYSWACRTGIGNESDWGTLGNGPDSVHEFKIEDAIQLRPLTKQSLAQRMANHLNVPVWAFLRRTDYSDTWSNLEERMSLRACKASNGNIPTEAICQALNKDDNERTHHAKQGFIFLNNGALHSIKSGQTPAFLPNGMYKFTSSV
jgi:hypothetical protein